MKRSGEPRRGVRRALRATAIGIAGLLGLCVALTLTALLLLRTERTATWTALRLLAHVHVYPGSTVRLARFHAGPSGWIEARDARLVEADTVQVASLAGIRLHVDWNALRKGELKIDSLRVEGPRVDLIPLLRGLATKSTAPPAASRPASARPGRIQIGSVYLIDGYARVPLTLRGKPAVLVVSALTVRASQVALAPGAALQLDSLGAELLLPEWSHPALLRARGALRDGRATLDSLALDTPGTHVTLRGAAPLQGGLDNLLANMQLDVAAQPLDGADLRPFLGSVPGGARLEGSVHVALQGNQLSHASGTAGAVLAADWGTHAAPHAQLETTWTDGRVRLQITGEAGGKQAALQGALRPFDATVPYDLEIRAGSGSLALRGEVVPRTNPHWRIDAGQLRHFDLAAVVPNAPVSDLTGTVQGHGSGWSPDSLLLDAVLRLSESRLATLPIDSLHAAIAMRTGAVTLTGGGGAHGTAVRFDAGAHPFLADPALDHATVRFERFDLTQWTSVDKPSTLLGGTLKLAPPGLDLHARRAHAELQLAPSRIGEQAIAGGQFHLALDASEIRADGQVQFPNGGFALEATANPFSARPAYAIQRFDFTALDLGALLGTPGLRTQLTGNATLEAEGASADKLHAHATLRLDRSTALGMALDGAHADAAYETGAAQLVADVSVPGGGGNIEASGRLRDPVPTYRAHGHLQSTSLAQLLGRKLPDTQAQLDFAAEGTGLDRDALRVDATVTGNGSVGTARVDSVAAQLSIAGDRVRIDSLRVRGNVLHAEAAGTLRLPQLLPGDGEALELSVRVLDPAPLAPLLHRRRLAAKAGRLSAAVRGDAAGAAWSAEFDAEQVTVDSIAAAHLQLRGSGTLDPGRHALASRATAALDTLSVAGLELRTAAAAVDYDHETLRVVATAALDEANQFRIAAHHPSGGAVSVLDTLALDFGANHWALDQPVQLTYANERLQVDDFQVATGNRRITVNGVLDRHGEQSLVARVDSLQIDVLAAVLGWPRLKGHLGGDLQVTGPAAAPRAVGRVALDLRAGDSPGVHFDGRFAHEHGALELQARLTNPAQDSLVVDGRIPLALPGLAPAVQDTVPAARVLDVRAHTDGFDLGSLAPFAPPNTLRGLAGRLQVKAQVTGSTYAPHLEGELHLADGAIQITALGAPYTGISLAAGLAGNELTIEQLKAHSGRGTLAAHGGVRFGASRAMHLAVTLDRFRAVANRTLHVEASGKIDLTGTTTAPEVRGSVTMTDTDIDVSGDAGSAASQVELTEADLRMLEDNFGYRPRTTSANAAAMQDSALLDVVVEAGRDTWVRRHAAPRLALEISGNVTARKQPGEKLQVFGRMEVLPQRSYAEQLGRRFDVESGSVVMNGDPLQSLLDFAAKWEVPSAGNQDNPEATITLKAQGTMNDLRLKFTSDPPMSEMQILSYIATGQPPQGTTGQVQTSSGASSTGTALAFAQASALAEDVGASLGLDVMQVRNDGVDGATMVAGSYFNTKTYLGIRQSAVFQTQTTESTSNKASTEIEVEYELLQWLLVNLQGGVGDLRLMFRTRHAY